MAKEVSELAQVLASLQDWSDARRAPIGQEVESLRLIVVQMATALALHEVQIAKLREAVLLLSAETKSFGHD